VQLGPFVRLHGAHQAAHGVQGSFAVRQPLRGRPPRSGPTAPHHVGVEDADLPLHEGFELPDAGRVVGVAGRHRFQVLHLAVQVAEGQRKGFQEAFLRVMM
jgi:hypothetical protein